MAIGDTWETINTYAFVAGETIITAGFLNDAVNDLQFLYQRADSKVNAWTANTNTNVTLTNNTADQLVGLSVTFTPSGSKVFFTYSYCSQFGYETGTFYQQAGYKVNSGAITYIGEDAAHTYASFNYMTTYYVLGVTVTPSVSNTITMYMKTGAYGSSTTYYWGRILVMEQGN